MNKTEIKAILPHRDPMLLVDEAFLNEDGTATGFYTVKGDEYFLQGHFPGNPIVPGVILCEIMVQSSCVLFQDKLTIGRLPVYTGIDKVRFKTNARPGDVLRIDISIKDERDPFYFLKGKITVDGKVCMQGDFSFAIVEVR